MNDLLARYMQMAKQANSEIAQVVPEYNNPANNMIYGVGGPGQGSGYIPRIRSTEETKDTMRSFNGASGLPVGALKMMYPGI